MRDQAKTKAQLVDELEMLRQRVADRVQKELALPANIEGHHIFTTVSIGIASGMQKHERPEDLLRDADCALYQAKARGKARHALFDTGGSSASAAV